MELDEGLKDLLSALAAADQLAMEAGHSVLSILQVAAKNQFGINVRPTAEHVAQMKAQLFPAPVAGVIEPTRDASDPKWAGGEHKIEPAPDAATNQWREKPTGVL